MTKEVQCFWLEPVEVHQLSLRRYSPSTKPLSEHRCTGRYRYHNASIDVERFATDQIPSNLLHNNSPISGNLWDHADPRWPKKCDYCDYIFQDNDEWQANLFQLHESSLDGNLYTLHNAPTGAMWNADWMEGIVIKAYEDGITLTVKTPAGLWVVDGPSYNNGERGLGWDRTGKVRVAKGELPTVSATPSIAIGPGGVSYHGFLTNGKLIEC